jgi:hypothetical protein
MSIILYSTNCPKCRVLDAKLHLADIEFEVCEDIDKMESLGITSAPVLGVDDKLLTFKEAVDWINNGGGKTIEN